MYFINYLTKNNESVCKTTENEETAMAIVDSEASNGAKYMSVLATIPQEEDNGQVFLGEWEGKGGTMLNDKWYNVYVLFIKSTYGVVD